MAKRKLTPEQENWLFLHFPDMTNRQLAEELTEMIRKENQKQLARLKRLLEEDFSEGARKVINRKIESLEKFTGVSESLVKRYARNLHCPRKSREHLVTCNQEKAKATNYKRWLKKAEKVEHIMDWLRTFDERDIRYCFIEGEGQLKSFRVSINKFNRYEGYERSVFLTSQFFPEVGLLRVNASLFRTTQ
jgi:hypothetical protein